MKKIFSYLLAFHFIVSLAACGKKAPPRPPEQSSSIAAYSILDKESVQWP